MRVDLQHSAPCRKIPAVRVHAWHKHLAARLKVSCPEGPSSFAKRTCATTIPSHLWGPFDQRQHGTLLVLGWERHDRGVACVRHDTPPGCTCTVASNFASMTRLINLRVVRIP